jgi:hypothetical protein
MAGFDDSTLWRISAYERLRAAGAAGLDAGATTLLPTTLQAELGRLQGGASAGDVLEVVAACLRHREPALLNLALGECVWPLTLFPGQQLYHSPRDAAALLALSGLQTLRLIEAERPGVRPPGHVMHERIAGADKYHPLAPLLWTLALHGPRPALLAEISGRAAYRLASGHSEDCALAPGALAPAVTLLRRRAVSLREIARWPGLSVERASRLLNALYLTDALMVTRSHPSARKAPLDWRALLGRGR